MTIYVGEKIRLETNDYCNRAIVGNNFAFSAVHETKTQYYFNFVCLACGRPLVAKSAKVAKKKVSEMLGVNLEEVLEQFELSDYNDQIKQQVKWK